MRKTKETKKEKQGENGEDHNFVRALLADDCPWRETNELLPRIGGVETAKSVAGFAA